MKKELGIIIPVYNEEGAIALVLDKWIAKLDEMKVNYCIHAYNDGSKDNTKQILENYAKKNSSKVIAVTKINSGHGPTILQGYKENVDNYEWLFQIDSDDEMGPENFDNLWDKRHNYDFLVGFRDGRKQPLSRKIISAISRLSVKCLYGSKTIWDVNTPYRLMRTQAFKDIYEKIPENTFAPNVIISGIVAKYKLRYFEMPVAQKDRQTGEVSIKKWKLLKAAILSWGQTFLMAIKLITFISLLIVVNSCAGVITASLFYAKGLFSPFQLIPLLLFFNGNMLLFHKIDLFSKIKLKYLLRFIIAILLGGIYIFIVFRFCKMVHQPYWGDEIEKFTVGFFLSSGLKIYDDFFCHHGIFPFVISHMWHGFFGFNSINYERIQGLLVYLLPCIIFYFMPMKKRKYTSFISSFIYLLILSVVWQYWQQGFPYCLTGKVETNFGQIGGVVLYQAYGGIFLGLTTCLILPYLFNLKFKKSYMFLAGVFASCAFFCALSFAISLGLITLLIILKWILYPERKDNFSAVGYFILGGIFTVIIIGIYLAFYGSILGYIEYHIFYNLRNYSQVATRTLDWKYSLEIFLKTTDYSFKSMNVFCFIVITGAILLYVKNYPVKFKRDIFFIIISAVSLFIAILYSSTRYMQHHFHGSSALLFALIIFIYLLNSQKFKKQLTVYIFIIIYLIMIFFGNKFYEPYKHDTKITSSTIVQSLTTQNEKIHLGSFGIYYVEKRLPVFDYFFNTHYKKYGGLEWKIKRPNLADEIQNKVPGMIHYAALLNIYKENMNLGLFLKNNYVPIKNSPYAISKERLEEKKDIINKNKIILDTWGEKLKYTNNDVETNPNQEINKNNSFLSEISYPNEIDNIIAISFMFATYRRTANQRNGQIKIELLDNNKKIIESFHRASSIFLDNQYHKFNLTKKGCPKFVRFSSTSDNGKGITLYLRKDNKQPIFELFYK